MKTKKDKQDDCSCLARLQKELSGSDAKIFGLLLSKDPDSQKLRKWLSMHTRIGSGESLERLFDDGQQCSDMEAG